MTATRSASGVLALKNDRKSGSHREISATSSVRTRTSVKEANDLFFPFRDPLSR